MAAAVDADHTIAMLDEEQHLGVPVVAAERPAMMEDNRLALAPVFVKNFNAVLRFDKAHVSLPDISAQMNVERRVVLLLHALVNKLGEKGWVDHELTPLCVVCRRRFSRHRLFQRSARFLQCCDVIPNSYQ